MAILWCGGEDVHFPAGGALSVETGNYRQTDRTRCALGGAVEGKSLAFPGGAITSCWFTFRFYPRSTPAAGTRFAGLVKTSTTNSGLWVGTHNSTATKLALYKWDGSTLTLLASESGTSVTNALHRVDVHLQSFGASATVTVYLDGASVITYSGDVTVTGVTDLDGVGIRGGTTTVMSELIVADEDVRAMSLASCAPSAAGDANAWTGAYTDINEVTINDANEVYTNATGQDAQFNLGDLPSGTFTIKAVKIAARCAKSSGATAGSVCLGVKSGGTIDPGASQSLTTAWATYERLMDATNPVTSNLWQQSEINPLQLNLRSAA